MAPDTFKQTLTALCNRRPFRAFTVELDDGTRLEIDQPHAVLTRNNVAVFLPPNAKPIWFDHMNVIRILDDRLDADRADAA
ncbi:hypothetical protein [Limnoglobus roseus]|uniref:Uncharacterized protein n=1 Tax=Limnoglobus roseus TaxID=2598579 RepID=A0A5C1AQN9_9BACT|nr:hypothetical protein [Limnoglobus roseus]QEL20346.1 hypothetical protein PX52LOC_07439 [Limnoglobus roseus]